MTVDPKVYAVAEAFVEDMLEQDVPARLLTIPRPVLIQRAASAMQQAIEQELEAIRAELVG